MMPNPDDQAAVTVQQVPANQLSFRVMSAGTGDRLILCLHGFPESSLSWRYQIAPLAQAGYRVWAPDLRGYAGTTRPGGIDAYQIDRLLHDTSGLLDAAQAKRAILVGHDWGGILAWYYAMRYGHRVEALIILNAPHPACFLRELHHWRQLRRSWYMGVFQIPRLAEMVLTAGDGYLIGKIFERVRGHRDAIPEDMVRLYRQQACEPGALTAMLNYYRAAVRGGGAARQRKLGYVPITVPTLVIWGLHDLALVRQNLNGLEAWAHDLSLITFDDAGHFVHQDRPEQVTREIVNWLEKRTHPSHNTSGLTTPDAC